MSTLLPRQPNTNRTPAFSGSVLAALLSALLLLSPTTARALAHVLVENGVAIPSHVVRVLDTIALDPVRETPRRRTELEEKGALGSVVVASVEREEPAPGDEIVAVLPPVCPTMAGADTSFLSLPARKSENDLLLRRTVSGRRSPRAPPVFANA